MFCNDTLSVCQGHV